MVHALYNKYILVTSSPKNSLDLYSNVHITFHGCKSAIPFEDGMLENSAREGKGN